MHLDAQEKALISKEIEELEKQSSAELVAVVTKKSAKYRFQAVLVNVSVVAILSFILTFLSDISTMSLFQTQVLLFIFIYFLFDRYDSLVLKLLPKVYKHSLANEYAQEQFYNLGLNRTKTNQALMFFVSLDEKYVEIISDETIKSKIPDEYWQKIVDEFIIDVKRGHLSNGYLKAIQSCSEVLIKNFPIQDDDENELPNDVIELI